MKTKFDVSHLLTIVLLAVLGVYALTGLFVRPVADDLFFIDLAHKLGPAGVLSSQYYGWQGRFGYSFLMGVYMPIAPDFVIKTFPALLIALLVLTLYKILKRFVRHPLLAASGLTLAFLTTLPLIWQSFYWYGSSTNYVVPLIVANGVLLWLLR